MKRVNNHKPALSMATLFLSKPQKIYPLLSQWRILLLAVGFLAILMSVLIIFGARNSVRTTTDWIIISLMFLFFLLLGLDLIYQGLRSRLITTTEGIIYCQPHFKLSAQWAEISHVIERAGRVAIVLQESSYEGNELLRWLVTRLGPWDRVIPLDPYIDRNNWRDSDFGDKLRHYAPHLIQSRGGR
ncbi:MAG: hypothetical protein U0401_14880 [Anaerolineae bacterium]